MKQLINIRHYVNTFSKKQIELFCDYIRVKNLIERGLKVHKIHKITGIKKSRLCNWVYGSSPTSFKSVTIAKKRNYFLIKISSKEAPFLAYLIGWSMGDGNVSNDSCRCWFYGRPRDLDKLNRLIKTFHVSGKIYVYKNNNGKMCVHDASFTRLLVAIGAPVGDKTNNNFDIPKWIQNSGERSEIKKKFLQGLFDSELNEIKRNNKTKFSFQTLKFYTVKTKPIIKSGISYLDQIRKIVSEFGITTTSVKIGRTYVRKRDKNKMTQLYFIIHSNYINLFNFITKIGFLFNTKRRNSSLRILKELGGLAKIEEEKIKKYKEVLKLRKNGSSLYKISTQTNVPISSVKNWICRGCKPRLFRYINTI